MNRQQQIDEFLLKAHQLALTRLRAHPERLQDGQDLLTRWRLQDKQTRSDSYWDEWSALLAFSVDGIEHKVGGSDDHAGALRNVSPMSVLITQQERGALLREVRQFP